MQILVLGMHRSGTSLTTRLINMMGAYFAPEGMAVETRADNPKGYWERKDVVKINQGLIAHMRSKQPGVPAEIARDIGRVVLSMDGFRPWVMKDPRLCVTLPYWLPYLEVPVAVIVWRNPMEIARSLESREGKPLVDGLAEWEHHAVSLIRATQHLPKVFTTHAGMISDPVGAVKKLYNDLVKEAVQGLRLPCEREIRAFIDPKLYHERETTTALNSRQERICAMLRGEMAFENLPSPLRGEDSFS